MDTNPSSSSTSSFSGINGWGSRTVDIFEKLEQVGEGTYGQVWKAQNKYSGEIVALKKVRMDNEKEGFPITAIREIKILKELDHENIINLKDIVTSSDYSKGKGSIFMVFEYMDHDLTGLMDSRQIEGQWFKLPQIKCYMKQLLEGLYYCHKNNVLHRDIKGSNLLINNHGQLKLADFGLARPYNENSSNYTNRVITLWYRPPELILGATVYGPAIDMWSVGCILAELLAKKPIFPGRNEIDQLDLIFQLCGTPTPENWPDVEKLPYYQMLRPKRSYKRKLRDVYKDFYDHGLDLVDKLLCLDPQRRISAEQALDHDFFFYDPQPCDKSKLPVFESSHEFVTKKRRAAAQVQNHNNQNQHSSQNYSSQPLAKRQKSSNDPNSRSDTRKADNSRPDYNQYRSNPSDHKTQYNNNNNHNYHHNNSSSGGGGGSGGNHPSSSQRFGNKHSSYRGGSSHGYNQGPPQPNSYNGRRDSGSSSSSSSTSSQHFRGNENHSGPPHRPPPPNNHDNNNNNNNANSNSANYPPRGGPSSSSSSSHDNTRSRSDRHSDSNNSDKRW